MEKKTQLNLWYAAIAMAVLLAIQFATATPFESIAYSQFQAFLKDGKIEGLWFIRIGSRANSRRRSRTATPIS
jgi:hypothetical protein